MHTLLNGVMFNVSWLLIVHLHSAGPAALVAIVHLVLHDKVMGKAGELYFIALMSVTGYVIDQVLFAAGVLKLSTSAGYAPLWLSCLWPVLATTPLHAFSPLRSRPLLAVVIGAIGGAASYVVGTQLSDIEFGAPHSVFVIALLWAVLFPAILRTAAVVNLAQESRNASSI